MTISAKTRAADQLLRISVPKVTGVMELTGKRMIDGTQEMRNRMDPELTIQARLERAHNTDLDNEEHWWHNIAVFRVVNQKGKVLDYLSAANTPKGKNGIGIHSEAYVLEQFRHSSRTYGEKCGITQIYSERIPCPECSQLLNHYCPGAIVFYSVGCTTGNKTKNFTRTQMLKNRYELKADQSDG